MRIFFSAFVLGIPVFGFFSLSMAKVDQESKLFSIDHGSRMITKLAGPGFVAQMVLLIRLYGYDVWGD